MSYPGCGGSYSSGSFSQRGKQPGKEQQPGKKPGGGDQCGGSNVTVSGPVANANCIFKVDGDSVGNISISGRPKQQDKGTTNPKVSSPAGEGSHSSGSSSQHDKQPGKESGECKVDIRRAVSNKNWMGTVRGNDVGNINISG